MNHLDTEIIVSHDECGERLDKLLFQRFGGAFSRTYFQDLIERQLILLNGEPVKKRIKPDVGDEIEVQWVLTPESAVSPEPISLNILFEDEHLLAINKPAGMVVHPAPGNWSGTFVNGLLAHCGSVAAGSSPLRPGIVHRLDKDTSGVLVAAKTTQAHQGLCALFAERRVEKDYLTVCVGNPGDVTIEAPLGRHPVRRKEMAVVAGGRDAHSVVTTLVAGETLSLVRVVPRTGRTHQIRVHLKHVGTPVLGDVVYGNEQVNRRYGVERQMLHAYRLAFTHPVTGNPIHLEAEIPSDLAQLIATEFAACEW